MLPICSRLLPGESQDVEFVLFGSTNCKVSCTALCEVEGGPEYKLSLAGEASTVSFALDRDNIDFGKVIFSEKSDQEIVLFNNGRVPFNFSFILDLLSSPGLIEPIPASGKVLASEKLKVMIYFKPLTLSIVGILVTIIWACMCRLCFVFAQIFPDSSKRRFFSVWRILTLQNYFAMQRAYFLSLPPLFQGFLVFPAV